MYSGRTINLVAPLVWEANVSPAAAAVYAEVIRNAMRDSGIVAGPAVVSLSTVDPVLYPGLLAGEPTRQVSEGVAVFNGLSVNVPGPYTLTVEAEEDLLQMHSTSPTTGTITLWRVYNIPVPPEPGLVGRWVNFTGAGVTLGIWGKIVDVGNHVVLGDYFTVEQPSAATSLSTLTGHGGLVSVKYNAADPTEAPTSYLMNATTAWFAWNPTGGEYLDDVVIEETDTELSDSVEIEVLRHVSVHITSSPATAEAGQTYQILAVLRNQDGTTATDLDGPDAALEVRDGATPVYSDEFPVVNGAVSAMVPMPGDANDYTIWVQYQGTWYEAEETTDSKALTVTEELPDEEPPGPDPVPGAYPEENYQLVLRSKPLELERSSRMELEAPDSYIEVTVR